MDPAAGRFASVDAFSGFPYEPPSLHKYLYAQADPINQIDPSGLTSVPAQVSAMNARAQVMTTSVIPLRIYTRIAAGNVGNFWRALGRYAEGFAARVFGLLPNISVLRNQLFNGRILDFVLQSGGRRAFLEAKYSLPWGAGAQLTRAVSQLRAGLAAAQSGEQVVLWSLKAPSATQVNVVTRALGSDAARVQFIHGVEGLYKWAVFLFGL